MIAFVPLLWLLALGLGPDGLVLSREILRLEGPVALPLAPLARTAEGLWLVPHQEAGWARAFYTGPQTSLDFAVAGRTERLLPKQKVPRLFLYAPYFFSTNCARTPSEEVDLRDLPVDTVEYLMKALLEAHLQGEMGRQESPYRKVVVERSADLLRSVPSGYQREAYLEAVAEFGAHILSIAHEVNRTARRAVATGRVPCTLVEHRVPLLVYWEASFLQAPFRGRYGLSAARSEEGDEIQDLPVVEWVESKEVLELRDKELFVRHALGGSWVGRAELDFAELCGS